MKILFERDVLLPAAQAMNNVVERRQTLPILGNVLIVAEKSQITFTATDMEVELVVTLEHDSADSGSVTLPARKLLDICRALPPAAKVEVALEDDKARIKSGRSRFLLATLPASDFPNIGSFDTMLSVSCAADALRDLVEMTQFAMAHQDVRYFLNGLLIEFLPDRIRTVATDGHRLALCERMMELPLTEPLQVIVPRKGVAEMVRLLAGKEGEVQLEVGSSHIKLGTPGHSMTSKLVDGRFPDYERVIPSGGQNSLVADREALRQAFARASILSNEKFRGVRLVIKDGLMTAVAHNPEQEEAEEEVPIDYTGEELEIGFNVSYLLDVLGTLASERVRFEFIDANSSCLIENPEEPSARYVIMPMRL